MESSIETSTVGISYSIETDSYKAGRAIAETVNQQVPPSANMVGMVFFSVQHDAIKFKEGIRSVLSENVKLFGCSTTGVITKDHLGYQGHQAAMALISSETILCDFH